MAVQRPPPPDVVFVREGAGFVPVGGGKWSRAIYGTLAPIEPIDPAKAAEAFTFEVPEVV